MKRFSKRQILQVDEKLLSDLKWEDFVQGIRDPERREIAKRYGLLKWTPIFEKNRTRAFGNPPWAPY